MALETTFPQSPNIGDTFTLGGQLYKWSGVSWEAHNSAEYTQGATPPTNPVVGDEWLNTDNGILYKRVSDGTDHVWLDITGTGIGGSGGGSWNLIETATPLTSDNLSEVQFSTLGDYRIIKLIGTLVFATNPHFGAVRFSIDGGTTFLDTGYEFSSYSKTYTGDFVSSHMYVNPQGSSHIQFELTIDKVLAKAFCTFTTTDIIGSNIDSCGSTGCLHQTLTNINAITLLSTTGQIFGDGSNFSLYGITS